MDEDLNKLQIEQQKLQRAHMERQQTILAELCASQPKQANLSSPEVRDALQRTSVLLKKQMNF